MKINLLYGKSGKVIELPSDRTTIIQATSFAPIHDKIAAVREALKSPIDSLPLSKLVHKRDTVAIVFSDITRPMPYNHILPPMLEELRHVPDNQILFINATGTHRPNTHDELVEILGDSIVKRFEVLQHDCYDETNLLHVGTTSRGNDVFVNSQYMQSSVRILTGFIEPHLFAGFSGGPKAVLPGIAGAQSIFTNHNVEMIAHRGSGFARTEGNPLWEEMLEAALMTSPTFLLNITQTDDRQITGVFAGDLIKAHAEGVELVRQSSMVPVSGLFDIVISTAGGYPLDINMYQSVKGMAVAEEIVKEGGAVILATECQEGLPEYGEYSEIVALAETPEELLNKLDKKGVVIQDQWDVQIQARVCRRAKVFVYSDGLSDVEIRKAMGFPCHDIESTIDELLNDFGPGARIAVLPSGPLTVPYLREFE
jgi:nickel-dependent lactate racemase